jgi:hypothetical protein
VSKYNNYGGVNCCEGGMRIIQSDLNETDDRKVTYVKGKDRLLPEGDKAKTAVFIGRYRGSMKLDSVNKQLTIHGDSFVFVDGTPHMTEAATTDWIYDSDNPAGAYIVWALTGKTDAAVNRITAIQAGMEGSYADENDMYPLGGFYYDGVYVEGVTLANDTYVDNKYIYDNGSTPEISLVTEKRRAMDIDGNLRNISLSSPAGIYFGMVLFGVEAGTTDWYSGEMSPAGYYAICADLNKATYEARIVAYRPVQGSIRRRGICIRLAVFILTEQR